MLTRKEKEVIDYWQLLEVGNKYLHGQIMKVTYLLAIIGSKRDVDLVIAPSGNMAIWFGRNPKIGFPRRDS